MTGSQAKTPKINDWQNIRGQDDDYGESEPQVEKKSDFLDETEAPELTDQHQTGFKCVLLPSVENLFNISEIYQLLFTPRQKLVILEAPRWTTAPP